MSKERGSFGGASGGARSSGGPRGGVGLASRSMGAPQSFGAESGFSSRGLASLGKSAERPSLTFGNTARPSLNLGNTDRPTLSFSGNKFESSKQTTAKNLGVRYSPEFKGTPLASIRNTEVSTNKPSINRPEVAPRPTVRPSELTKPISLSRNRLQPAVTEVRSQKPSGLISPEARPQIQFAPKVAPEIRGQKVTDIYKKAEVQPTNLLRNEVIPQPAVNAPKMVSRELIVTPVVQVRPSYRTQIDIPTLQRLKPEQPVDKVKVSPIDISAVERTVIRPQELSRLAYLPFDEELIDDDAKKAKLKFEAEQIDRVAMAYLRAGLVANKGEALRRVDRVLGKDPAVLANNSNVEAHVTPRPVPERIGITAPVEVPAISKMSRTEILPQVKSDVQVKAETKIQLLAKAKGVAAPKKISVDQRVPATQPEMKMQMQQEQQGVQKMKQQAKEKLEKIKVWNWNVKTPTIKHNDEKNPFKVDKPKQKNRLQLWRDAVRNAFPYFDPEYRVQLGQIAKDLKGPDSSTESTLVEQLNLEADGSEYAWRNPLLYSDTPVTQGEARIAGEYHIFTKPPVVLNEEGLDAKKKDVELVMSGKPKEEVFASAE